MITTTKTCVKSGRGVQAHPRRREFARLAELVFAFRGILDIKREEKEKDSREIRSRTAPFAARSLTNVTRGTRGVMLARVAPSRRFRVLVPLGYLRKRGQTRREAILLITVFSTENNSRIYYKLFCKLRRLSRMFCMKECK